MPLPKLSRLQITGNNAAARVRFKVPLKKAELHYTTDGGEWQKRQWQTVDAEFKGRKVAARLPVERPLVCYFSVTDDRDLQVSTDHAELPGR